MLVMGIVVGVLHLRIALRGWFVARNTEPASFWVFLFTGPVSTLPASITAFFKPKIGGLWLICGALVSYVFAMAALGAKGDFSRAIWFLTRCSGPMLALGLAFLFLSRYEKDGNF